MAKLYFSILTLIILFSVSGMAQPDYKRSSFTLLLLDHNEQNGSVLKPAFAKLDPPEKFFNNDAGDQMLKPSFSRVPVIKGLELLYTIPNDHITQSLKDQKIAQKILSVWFNRQADGTFNTDVLKQRGLYNANDNEFIMASASKRGTSNLMDMGLNLVNESYVMVFDFYELKTMAEYYSEKEIEASKRVDNGYRAKVRCYVYKLDFGEEIAARFFREYWISGNESDKNARKAAFDAADFNFFTVSNHFTEVSATQANSAKNQKSASELMDQLVANVLENMVVETENKHQDLRVKAMVMDTRPIASKIGKKEGLGFDQRYFVYENRQKRDGTVYPKRIAVVKSMKVVDNRNITTGESEPSLFYQIAGRRVDKMGMYLEQKNDYGLNLYLGYTYSGLTGAAARGEFYISKYLGDLVASGRKAKGLTSIKFYIDAAYGSEEFYTTYYNNFTRISLGVNKDFYPLKFMHWGPFLGYGLEYADFKDSDTQIESDFIEVGFRVGLNLSYRTQIIWSGQYNLLWSSKEVLDDGTVWNEDFEYQSTFYDRMGLSSSIGLRFMF